MSTYFQKRTNITQAALNIHDSIDVGDPDLWFTSSELTQLLQYELLVTSLAGLALRTRSKRAKSMICEALGYPTPKSFPKKQSRFSGQKFDLYVQKSDNLQIWNQEVDPERRYVLLMLDQADIICNVRVLTGVELANYDTTGTLTQKYQARLTVGDVDKELVSPSDTTRLASIVCHQREIDLSIASPVGSPDVSQLLPIQVVFEKLAMLIGSPVAHIDFTQERNRGAGLHKLVGKALGYTNFQDNGQFPDIRHQLLEVKLQTSSTIDLGLVCPDSEAVLDVEQVAEQQIRHCDVRYAIFYGKVIGENVLITNVYLTTGEDFFLRFPKFGGKAVNRKIQLRLPRHFFSATTD